MHFLICTRRLQAKLKQNDYICVCAALLVQSQLAVISTGTELGLWLMAALGLQHPKHL